MAIIAGFDKPDFFILLCWQSLLVVALALLYRSKIIVMANFFIFLIIFLSYLFTAEKVGGISISFGVVALLHLWRVVGGLPLMAGRWDLPLWLSYMETIQ